MGECEVIRRLGRGRAGQAHRAMQKRIGRARSIGPDRQRAANPASIPRFGILILLKLPGPDLTS